MDDYIKHLDSITLITTKNVKYLSDEPGNTTDPDGIWLVSGVIDGEVLATKGTATIKIPLQDTTKIEDYSLDHVFQKLESLNDHRRRQDKT